MHPSPITPSPAPPAPAGPQSVPVAAPPPSSTNWASRLTTWALLAGVVIGAWWAYQKMTAADPVAVQALAELRTETVAPGTVTKSMRLTGVTAAEKYVSLIAPQMRSSRSGRGRDASTTTLQTPTLPSIRSTRASSARTVSGNTANTGGASSGGDATGGAQSVASNSSASGGGGGGGGASTSRMSSGTPRSSGGGSASGGGRISTGGSSMGSTEAQLGQGQGGPGGGGGGGGAPGGGGGGGGRGGGGSFSRFGSGGDFALTLQTMAKPGVRVKKGDVVAEFDRQYMLQRLEDYKSSVAQYEANSKKLKADLDLYTAQHAQTIDIAKGELDKADLDLKTLPVRGNMDKERLQLAYEEAKAQFEQLKAEVRYVEISTGAQMRNSELDYSQAELELKRAEANADKMIVRTPMDGITVMQQTFVGSEFRQIQQGDQVFSGQLFLQIVEPGSMVINAAVNQVDAESLRVGAKAKVRFDAYPGLELPAHVVSVAAVTKTGGFRATYLKVIPVMLKLDKIDDRVIPDLSVSADVVLEESAAANNVVAPLESLFPDSPVAAPAAKSYVYVRDGEGPKAIWRRREVEVGLTSNTHAVIRSGLKAGEVVALDLPPSATAAKT